MQEINKYMPYSSGIHATYIPCATEEKNDTKDWFKLFDLS